MIFPITQSKILHALFAATWEDPKGTLHLLARPPNRPTDSSRSNQRQFGARDILWTSSGAVGSSVKSTCVSLASFSSFCSFRAFFVLLFLEILVNQISLKMSTISDLGDSAPLPYFHPSFPGEIVLLQTFLMFYPSITWCE